MEYQNQRETIGEQLQAQQQALTQIYKSVEQTRKIIMWSGIASLVMFVLPLIIFAVALPNIISTLTASAGGLGGASVGSGGGLLDSLNSLKDLAL
jgi:uncharacterized membrane protein